MVNNEELKADVNKCKDDVNGVSYRLNNVEKTQNDMNEKIDKLLETESKIDQLIQGERLLALSENNKSETKRRLVEHIEKIEQLTEHVEALFAEPLAYRRPPLSLEIP
jgi:chromosome segregation ATPase